MPKFSDYLSQNAPRILYINIFIEFLVIVTLGCVATLVNNQDCPEVWDTIEAYRWAAILLSFVAQFHFAYHSIVQHNMTELIAFLIVSVITAICFYSRVVILWQACSGASILPILMVVLSVIIAINQVFYFMSSRTVYENYKWKIFKMTVDDKVQKMIHNLEELKAMIKVNLLLQLLIFLGYFMFIDYEQQKQKNNYFWYIIDSILLAGYILVTRIGYISVKSKNQARNIKIFLVYLSLMQVYELVKFWPLLEVNYDADKQFKNEKYAIIVSQIIIGLAGIGTQIYTCIVGYRYYNEADDIYKNADTQQRLLDDNRSDVA